MLGRFTLPKGVDVNVIIVVNFEKRNKVTKVDPRSVEETLNEIKVNEDTKAEN